MKAAQQRKERQRRMNNELGLCPVPFEYGRKEGTSVSACRVALRASGQVRSGQAGQGRSGPANQSSGQQHEVVEVRKVPVILMMQQDAIPQSPSAPSSPSRSCALSLPWSHPAPVLPPPVTLPSRAHLTSALPAKRTYRLGSLSLGTCLAFGIAESDCR